MVATWFKKSTRHFTRAGSFYMSLIILSFFIFSCILALFIITTYEANKTGYNQSLYEQARKNTEICTQTLDSIAHKIVNLRYNPSLINFLRPEVNAHLSEEELLKKESELGFIIWNSIGQSNYFKGLYIEDLNGNGYLENSRIDSYKTAVHENIADINLDFTNFKYNIEFVEQNDDSCCIITSPIYNNNILLGYLYVLINNDFFDLVTTNTSSSSSEFVCIIDSNTGFPLSVDRYTSWSEGIKLFNTYPKNISNILSSENKERNTFALNFPERDFSSIASFYSNDNYSFGTICSVDKDSVKNIVTKYSKIQAVATLISFER